MLSALRSPESPASSLDLPVDRTVKKHNAALRRAPVLGSIPSRLRPGLCWPFGLVLLVLLSGPGSAAAQPCAEADPAVDNRGAELAADCTTLLGLQDKLRGTAVLNWARDVAMDDWDGLTVAGTPARVTKLELGERPLTGTLPPALNSLTGLTVLDLADNQLTGSIPALSALTSLTQLSLSHNQLTGSIPDLSALTRLEWLDLGTNRLTGPLPTWLTSLTRLTLLNLRRNQLMDSIPDLSALTRLTTLALAGNRLTGPLPPWLNRLTRLTGLGLAGNQLEGSIPDLSALTSLTQLFLSFNQLSGSIPPWLNSLTRLTELSLSNNRLKGSIPDLSALTRLTHLNLSSNQLTGPIPDLSALTRLTTLDLSNNQLTDGPTGRGGGRGGSRRPPADQHGDTPTTATALDLTTSAAGYLQSDSDVDYFRFTLPRPGILRATTTGQTDTQGQLWQERAGELVLVAAAEAGGSRTNFQFGVGVAAGPYYLAVAAGAAGATGAYTLDLAYSPGYFENPGAGSFQSGVGVLSGWVCTAEAVTIEFVRPDATVWRVPAATGTLRPDTASVCGHAESGFGLLWNWNKLGPGAHTVRAVVDDVVLAEHDVIVTTLGLGEFPAGLHGEAAVPDFPVPGRTTPLQWQPALQTFVIGAGAGGGGGHPGEATHALLENPAPGSLQSGIGVISGWVCAADEVEIVVEPGGSGAATTWQAGAQTLRPDTAAVCGETTTGFGLLFNWNTLGDGRHTVRALADGEEFAWSTVTVTTLGHEFARGLRGTAEVVDFPTAGQTVTVEWQEAVQNFVITDRE